MGPSRQPAHAARRGDMEMMPEVMSMRVKKKARSRANSDDEVRTRLVCLLTAMAAAFLVAAVIPSNFF